MAVSSTGPKKEPVFNSSGNAPTFAADLTDAAEYAAEYGNYKVDTTTVRNAFSGPWEGLAWYDTTLNQLYLYDGSGWTRQAPTNRFKGTITTAKSVVASQYWGKSTGSVTFNSTDDPNTAFSTATGLYTVPANGGGTYILMGQTKADGSGITNGSITFWRNGSKVTQSYNFSGAFSGGNQVAYVRCNAGDTLGMQVTAGYTTVVDSADNNFFEIVQVQY